MKGLLGLLFSKLLRSIFAFIKEIASFHAMTFRF